MLPSNFGENMFDDFFDGGFFGAHNPLYGKHGRNLMKTDIHEKDDTYEIVVDLPGFKKDNISAQLQDGYLTISASKGLDKDEQEKDGTYIRKERYSGSMSRSFYVGEGVTQDDVHAKFEDGILRLSLPKKDVKSLPKENFIAIEG